MLDQLITKSLASFFAIDAGIIQSGVSERCLCARLAMAVDCIAKDTGLDGYYADVEFNRKQEGKIKTMLDSNMQVVTITCDILLHSRGEVAERDNLIAIEMKKSERPEVEKKATELESEH